MITKLTHGGFQMGFNGPMVRPSDVGTPHWLLTLGAGWMEITPAQMRELADALHRQANEIEGK